MVDPKVVAGGDVQALGVEGGVLDGVVANAHDIEEAEPLLIEVRDLLGLALEFGSDSVRLAGS